MLFQLFYNRLRNSGQVLGSDKLVKIYSNNLNSYFSMHLIMDKVIPTKPLRTTKHKYEQDNFLILKYAMCLLSVEILVLK